MKLFNYLICSVFILSFVSAGVQICIDLDDPSAPSSLEVTSSGTNIILNWGVAIDIPDCSGIDYYNVSRDGEWIGTTSSDTLTYTDSNVPYGTYSYTVFAVDIVGHNSGPAIKNDVVVSSGGNNIQVGGGGSSSSYICIEKWTCENWGECVEGYEERECVDTQVCGTEKDKPEVRRECNNREDNEEDSKYLNSSSEKSENVETNEGFFSAITGAVIGGGTTSIGIAGVFIAFVLGSFGIIRVRRKRRLKK